MQRSAVARLHSRSLSRLLRLPLALMVALTGLAGALCCQPRVPLLTLWALASGIFLLSAASSVLNQVQERATDALMRRTAARPLASGALTTRAGTLIGLLLASGGLAVLAAGTTPATALLGLAALTWYLLVYTPLKRRTPLAVLAGTPCGALPPLMGWLAAGGALPAPQPLTLALIMLLWQVPHYWLLTLPDRDELVAAGFRTLPELSDRQLLAVSLRWVFALALATGLLAALGLPAKPWLQTLLTGLALVLAGTAGWLWHRGRFAVDTACGLRRILNLYLLLILLVLLGDALF